MISEVMESVDVIIIGAGISGLSAAYSLSKRSSKLKLVVLEASDRVGGRTLTVPLDCSNGKVDEWDLGGQWVSTTQPHILKIINELGLETYEQFLDGKKLMQLGDDKISSYSGDIPSVGSVWALIQLHLLISKCERIAQEVALQDPGKGPHAHLDSQTLETFIRNNTSSQSIINLVDASFRTVSGVDINRVSALFFFVYAKAAGGVMRLLESTEGGAQELKVKGGTQQISSLLTERIGKSNLKLNQIVTDVTEVNGWVEVRTQTDETYRARALISAVPLNLLRNINITPKLSHTKLDAINNMPMANYTKYIVTYEKAFWKERGFSGEVVSQGGKAVLEGCDTGPMGVVFDATSKDGHPALVGFLTGRQSNQWADKSDEERQRHILKGLASFFGEEALNPIAFIDKVWSREEYVGGCPTNYAPPGVAVCLPELRKPHGNIFFASTEAALKWPGYMDGAVESGQRATVELVEKIFPEWLTDEDRDILKYYRSKEFIPPAGSSWRSWLKWITVFGAASAVIAFQLKSYF